MINATNDLETATRDSFIPRVLDGGLTLDIERLSQTMAMLEGYMDAMLALDDPVMGSPRIEEDELQLRVASL